MNVSPTTPLFKELPGDCNLLVLRDHRHSELFEALSFVGRKGSRIVALFQVFQQGSEEFPGNYDFAVSRTHFFSFYVYQVGFVDHRECIAECRVCGLPASLYHPKPRRLHSFCLSYAAYARPEKARGRQLVADITKQSRRELRENLLKAAKTRVRFSYPVPAGESLSTQDTTKLLLDQKEAESILRTVDRRQSAKGPFRFDVGNFLRDTYARGLEVGGPEGGSIIRGVMRAARELGVDTEFVNSLRQEKHAEALDEARQLEYAAGLISTEAPGVPRSFGRAAQRSRTDFAQRQTHMVVGGSNPEPIAATEPNHGVKKKAWK
jgi:hypothetical protein